MDVKRDLAHGAPDAAFQKAQSALLQGRRDDFFACRDAAVYSPLPHQFQGAPERLETLLNEHGFPRIPTGLPGELARMTASAEAM